ncbi:MAG: energy transducer TonB [Cellvibrionaceae bacterium]
MRDASLSPGKGLWLGAALGAALLHLALAALAFWAPPNKPQGQAQAVGAGGVEISLGPAGSVPGGPEQEGERAMEQLEPKPEPKPEPEPESIPVEPEPQRPPQEMPPPQANLAGAAGKSGSKSETNTGSGDNTAGGGLPGDTQDYAATLLAWLEQHKEYPRQARLRRQQGTVMLYFVIDRQGRVLQHRIEQSAGYPALDEEVKKMIERAQPLPAMPAAMQQETLELVVPVQFFLR